MLLSLSTNDPSSPYRASRWPHSSVNYLPPADAVQMKQQRNSLSLNKADITESDTRGQAFSCIMKKWAEGMNWRPPSRSDVSKAITLEMDKSH